MSSGPATPDTGISTILDLITRQQAVATAIVQQLREQITALTARLSAAETELADLATTRKTVLELTATAEPAPGGVAEPTATAETTTTATLTDPTLARASYQQILAVFGTATTALRAKDVCRALKISVIPKHTEAIRPRLKRLVKRQILTEPQPGLFTLATHDPHQEPRTLRTK